MKRAKKNNDRDKDRQKSDREGLVWNRTKIKKKERKRKSCLHDTSFTVRMDLSARAFMNNEQYSGCQAQIIIALPPGFRCVHTTLEFVWQDSRIEPVNCHLLDSPHWHFSTSCTWIQMVTIENDRRREICKKINYFVGFLRGN